MSFQCHKLYLLSLVVYAVASNYLRVAVLCYPVLFCAMLSPFSALLPSLSLYKSDFISKLADGNP